MASRAAATHFSSLLLCSLPLSLLCNVPLQPNGVHELALTLRHVEAEPTDDAAADAADAAAPACHIWLSSLLLSTGVRSADLRLSILTASDGSVMHSGMLLTRGEQWNETQRNYSLKVRRADQ